MKNIKVWKNCLKMLCILSSSALFSGTVAVAAQDSAWLLKYVKKDQLKIVANNSYNHILHTQTCKIDDQYREYLGNLEKSLKN